MAFQGEAARERGAEIVSDGRAPTVIVLDPAGAGSHDELPATWRPLSDLVGVTWVRMPAAIDPDETIDRVLAELTGSVVLVATGAGINSALGAATRHHDRVLAVLAKDPVDNVETPELDQARIPVQVLSTDQPDVPLGHPAVVYGVVMRLLDLVAPEGTDDALHQALLGVAVALRAGD